MRRLALGLLLSLAQAALAEEPSGANAPQQPKPAPRAQEAPQPPDQRPSLLRPSAAMDPYAGVVVDSTVTFIGHEFYSSFVSLWRELESNERYTLQIVERPSARWGSLVWVEYRNQRLFNAFLSPGRRDSVRSAGQDAARQAYQAAVQADLQRLLFHDPDLAAEEY